MKRSRNDSFTADATQHGRDSILSYQGRFAPSPTGPLHWGSLFTAVVSYLDARANDGVWQLRIDDLDAPRSEPGAADAIQRCLDAHGLWWDGATDYQSQHRERYEHALDTLDTMQRLFLCTCSRRDLAGRAYPGTCRHRTSSALAEARAGRDNSALRVRVDPAPLRFTDRFAGPRMHPLAAECGDFVVRRRDGLVAYQLATAVDDGATEMTHVVRGRDLLDSTARQIALMDLLGLARPSYGHIPLLVDQQGSKLSKQHGAAPVEIRNATDNLARVLLWLGIPTPPSLGSPQTLLAWATQCWRDQNAAIADVLRGADLPGPSP